MLDYGCGGSPYRSLFATDTYHRADLEGSENVDACFGVVDVAALVGELARRGTVPVVPLREMPYGKEFCVRDPNGYILAFVESLRD